MSIENSFPDALPELPRAMGVATMDSDSGELVAAHIMNESSEAGTEQAVGIAEEMAEKYGEDMLFTDQDGKPSIFASKGSAAAGRQFGGYSSKMTQGNWERAFPKPKGEEIKQ